MQTQQVLQSNPWMMKQRHTAITNLLLSHRKGFLGALHAKLQESPEVLSVCEEQFDIDPKTPWYYDDVSGKPLDTQMVQAARREECQVIQTMGVWEPIPRPKNEKVISTRWVDVNKGDEQRPKYRSRLVARELKAKSGQSKTHWSDFFASMPPITALRILFSIAVTKKIPNKDGKLIHLDPTTCLISIDIKKAHFWSPATFGRNSSPFPPGMVGLLKKSLYGTRDAHANWEAAIKDVMLALGFLQAKSNACP